MFTKCRFSLRYFFYGNSTSRYTFLIGVSGVLLLTFILLSEEPRPTYCDSCFQFNFSYMLKEENVCAVNRNGEFPELIILISSISNHFTERTLIRNTWGSIAKGDRVRYIFVLGCASVEESVILKLSRESQTHHDIIQGSFEETYTNLPYKTMFSLAFAVKFCPGVKYVMKTDDDMFINIANLLHVLQKTNMDKTIIGDCIQSASVIRNPFSKWRISYSVYKNNKYPPFCSGTGYVMTTKTASLLTKQARNIPFIPLEDIHLALVGEELDIKFSMLPYFFRHRPHAVANINNEHIDSFFCNCAISVHELTIEERHLVWESLNNIGCANTIKNYLKTPVCEEFSKKHHEANDN